MYALGFMQFGCHAWDIGLQFTVMLGTSVFHVQFAE
jgi:hypothetical protein